MILKFSEVEKHIGAKVRILDTDPGMFGLQGTLKGLDKATVYNCMLPYPVMVELSWDSPLVKPVTIHVRDIELVGDIDLEISRGIELVERIENMIQKTKGGCCA